MKTALVAYPVWPRTHQITGGPISRTSYGRLDIEHPQLWDYVADAEQARSDAAGRPSSVRIVRNRKAVGRGSDQHADGADDVSPSLRLRD
jgi:hypothetical protein